MRATEQLYLQYRMRDDEPSPPPVPRKSSRQPALTDEEAVQQVVDEEIEAYIVRAMKEDY